MMTQPASLSALSQSQSAPAASGPGPVAMARKGLIAVLRVIARPAQQPHGALSHPLAARARRFMQGRD